MHFLSRDAPALRSRKQWPQNTLGALLQVMFVGIMNLATGVIVQRMQRIASLDMEAEKHDQNRATHARTARL